MLRKIRSVREVALAAAMRQRPEQTLRCEARMLGGAKRGMQGNFAAALRKPHGPHLIAELKKASPSAGVIRPHYEPIAIALELVRAGASALSVLTEPAFFQGSLEHLREVRGAVQVPLLRKDFIFHPYQLLESLECGADAVLLIVGMLSDEELKSLHSDAGRLGLECLVEVHTRDELMRAVEIGAEIVGINNRDLRTMKANINTAFALARFVRKGVTVVSESGVQSRADILKLREAGVNAVLVGEAIMRSSNMAAMVRSLLTA